MTTTAPESDYTILEFCEVERIGRSTVYREIADGKLIASKKRGRTIITAESRRAWKAALPKLSPATAAPAAAA